MGLMGGFGFDSVRVNRTGETGLTSSSPSKGDLEGISRGSRANSSLKTLGFDNRVVELDPDEEIDCLDCRGDILCSDWGCAPHPSTLRTQSVLQTATRHTARWSSSPILGLLSKLSSSSVDLDE